MTTICIGPVCLPIWHLFGILIVFIKPIYALVKRLFGIKDEAAENKKDESVPLPQQGEGKGRHIGQIKDMSEWDQYLKESAEEKLSLVVKFTAQWCKPCHRIQPFFASLAKSFDGIFCEIDVDNVELSDLVGNVTAMPTFRILKCTKEGTQIKQETLGQVVGAQNEELASLCKKYL